MTSPLAHSQFGIWRDQSFVRSYVSRRLDAQLRNFRRRAICFFVLLRSAFLRSLENPEPRYTLECYPAVLLLAQPLPSR